MKTLEELHRAYMKSKEAEENYNYDDRKTKTEENEFTVWRPVVKDAGFEIIKKLIKER